MINNKTIINEAKKTRRKKKPYDSTSYLTGSIALELDRFNHAMGTDIPDNFGSPDNSMEAGDASGDGANCCDGGMGESLKKLDKALNEAKRYVRRYYIRPQNIFCSNKADIIRALIDIGQENCTIYTLNNLGDEKDVTKLMNSDIIYYYDNEILYDKNRVKVMDYNLAIKHEEARKKLPKVNNTESKEFKDTYEDRITDSTGLEESKKTDIALDNAFNLDFDAINAFGECLTEAKQQVCCICGEPLEGYGNNPEPFMSAEEGSCCDGCNLKFVVPARMATLAEEGK